MRKIKVCAHLRFDRLTSVIHNWSAILSRTCSTICRHVSIARSTNRYLNIFPIVTKKSRWLNIQHFTPEFRNLCGDLFLLPPPKWQPKIKEWNFFIFKSNGMRPLMFAAMEQMVQHQTVVTLITNPPNFFTFLVCRFLCSSLVSGTQSKLKKNQVQSIIALHRDRALLD